MPSELTSILLGGILTLSGTFLVHAYQRHIERKRLCSALSVEIRLMEDWFSRVESYKDKFDDQAWNTTENFAAACEKHGLDPSMQLSMTYANLVGFSPNDLRTEIYENNKDKIGVLTSEQAAKVISFYDYLDEYFIKQETPNDISHSDMLRDVKTAINGIENSQGRRQQTLEALNQSIWEMYNPFRDVTYYPIQGGLFPDENENEDICDTNHPRNSEEQTSTKKTTH